MKNVALLAVILGVLGSAANAESAVNEAPTLTLAFNSDSAVTWSEVATAHNTDVLNSNVELELDKTMEEISVALDKKLEDKISKELEYAMH